MIHLITSENASMYDDALDKMFQLRHEIFVRSRGWPLNVENGREIDQFDTEDTTYLIKMNKAGDVTASMRMLSTERPHLMSDVLGYLCDGEIPRGPGIWESSRGSTRFDHRGDNTFGQVLVGMLEFSMLWGIEGITFVLDTPIFPAMVAVGWDIKPLGAPQVIDGESYIAGILNVTPEGLKAARKTFQVTGTQLTYARPMAKTA